MVGFPVIGRACGSSNTTINNTITMLRSCPTRPSVVPGTSDTPPLHPAATPSTAGISVRQILQSPQFSSEKFPPETIEIIMRSSPERRVAYHIPGTRYLIFDALMVEGTKRTSPNPNSQPTRFDQSTIGYSTINSPFVPYTVCANHTRYDRTSGQELYRSR